MKAEIQVEQMPRMSHQTWLELDALKQMVSHLRRTKKMSFPRTQISKVHPAVIYLSSSGNP